MQISQSVTSNQLPLLRTYEVLTYYEMAAAVRVFIYPDFIRCGALWLAAGMGGRISLRDRSDKRIVMVEIPEQFQQLAESTVMGDGHPQRFNGSPRMIQLISRVISEG